MKLSSLNWKNVEDYLKNNDLCILPIGSTEQHAFLSLSTDSIFAEKISLDAAEPLNIPVFPVMPYGHTPLFREYPGTVSLRMETLGSIVEDVLNSLSHYGFRRIFIVNGHGGNIPVAEIIEKWKTNKPDVRVKFHSWWKAPKTWAKISEIDPVASHASWMENFKWTRLKDVTQPDYQKKMTDIEKLKQSTPEEVRRILGDGNYGGFYQRNDEEMNQIWEVAVNETRELILSEWD